LWGGPKRESPTKTEATEATEVSAVREFNVRYIKSFLFTTAKTVTVYAHRCQIEYKFTSDYPYRTFKVSFNSLRKALLGENVKVNIETKGWKYCENEIVSGKKYRYCLKNNKLGIIMATNSLSKDLPIVIYIFPSNAISSSAFTPANERPELGPEPIVIQISKRWDKTTGNLLGTTILIYFTGDPRKNYDKKIIEFIKKHIAHREIDFERAERKLIRIEMFTRIDTAGEERVMRTLDVLKIRYANVSGTNNKHGHKEDVVLENNAGTRFTVNKVYRIQDLRFWTKYRADVKIYRKKNFNFPERNYTDHPKLEIAYYNIDWKDLDEVIKEGSKILSTIVHASEVAELLIEDPDHPILEKALPDIILEQALIRHTNEHILELIPQFIKDMLSKTQLKLIEEFLKFGNLRSSDLKDIATILGVSVRAVRYAMKKLEETGLVRKFRIANNQWIYLLNTEALSRSINSKPTHEKKRKRRTNKLEKVYLLVRAGYSSTTAIARVLGISKRQVRNYMRKLIEMGLVEVKKVGKHNMYYPRAIPEVESPEKSIEESRIEPIFENEPPKCPILENNEI